MTSRKAGDSLLKAAYLAELMKQGRQPGALGTDVTALQQLLDDRGSAPLGIGDLRLILRDAASPRKTAEMGPAEKLGVIERYLQDNFGNMAPMVFPVQDRLGVYGASVIDGDRLVAHNLSKGNTGNEDLLFAPAAVPGITHVLENSGNGDQINTYAGAMSTQTARDIYRAAAKEGFNESYLMAEDWVNGPEVLAQTGPIVKRLFQDIRQNQNMVNARHDLPSFQIVPSRGTGVKYDVLGMRRGTRNMSTVRLPGEPGWLGNPYVANDAGGQYSRQEATDLFRELVEKKAEDPVWRQAFLDLRGKRIGYYKPDEDVIHLHALQNWITQNSGGQQ